MILAKKKKKKITDPGWVYSSPLTPIPVDNPEFSSTEIYEYIRSPISDWQPDPLNRYTPLMQQMNQAFFEYATEAGPIFIAKATAQAAAGWYFGVYPTFWAGLAAEAGVDLIVGPIVLTIIDPADKWDGGWDEYPSGESFISGFKEGWIVRLPIQIIGLAYQQD